MAPERQQRTANFNRCGVRGVEAALKILAELDTNATVLFASDNSLGDDGAWILFEGLRELRRKRKRDALLSGDTTVLGLVDIHLAGNAMTDTGVLHALRYASEDHVLEKLDFRSQDIHLYTGVDEMTACINLSAINCLSFSGNTLDECGFSYLLRTITVPLSTLHFDECNLPTSTAEAIAHYLSSPASRRLVSFHASHNNLGLDGVSVILSFINRSNYTLSDPLFWFNAKPPFIEGYADNEYWQEQYVDDFITFEKELQDEAFPPEMRPRELQHFMRRVEDIHRFEDVIKKRNQRYAMRVRQAARRVLGPAQIVLLGREGERAAKSTFRLLDLPGEIQRIILRYLTSPPDSPVLFLSDSQWSRVTAYASDRSKLQNRAERSRKWTDDWRTEHLRTGSTAAQLEMNQEMRSVFDREMLDYEAEVGCNLFEGSE
ncbi:hypothetical protein Q8F55_005821 [Vanrija albida]|uniref:F-box domain-containing protein n=1 Tax=Vanrija albida TaxID=181172 RepID=A0ABR3Q3H7_9TREE